jgi:hypothetical protein
MRLTPLFLPAVLLTLLTGCSSGSSVSFSNGKTTVRVGSTPMIVGSGKVETEERKATGFRGVSAAQGVQVVVEVADAEAVTVEADDNLLGLIKTDVSGRTLRVRVTGSLETSNPLRVKVKARALESLEASSGASVRAAKLDGGALKVEVSSGAKVTAAGSVERLSVQASSGASFDGAKLSSDRASVDASSGAAATVRARAEVSGSASSGASVRYAGNPAKVGVKTSSGGSAGPA